MVRLVVNPEDGDAGYLAGLDKCFPARWNSASFYWYLKRPFDSKTPDLLAVDDDGEIVAGVGLNYRQLRVPGREIINVGVLTAAWTLRAYRGRGWFAGLVEKAIDLGESRGCKAIISFIVAGNASVIPLRQRGAAAVPSFYITATKNRELDVERMDRDHLRQFDTARPFADEHSAAAVQFHYSTSSNWREQFMARPNATQLRQLEDTLFISELAGSTERLQLLHATDEAALERSLAVIAADVVRRGKHFFYYSTSSAVARYAAEIGLSVKPGRIMINDARGRDSEFCKGLGNLRWAVQPGDRM